MKFLYLFFTIISVQVVSADEAKDKFIQKDPERILFVGNSYLYYNDSLHNHFRRMVEEAFPNKIDNLEFKSATIGGSRLSHHNIDHLLNHKNLSVSKPFDLVILQGGSGEVLTKKSRNEFAKESRKLIKKIRKAGSESALYMIHAYSKSHNKYDPNMINKVIKTYEASGIKNKVLVLPVGIAFEKAYELDESIELHKFFDGSHPDILGTYLAASVLYASIYKKDPTLIDYDYFGAINVKDREFLQKVAKTTVEEYYNIKLYGSN
jgi:lysophospholipase L1-like esterase